jgi:hypothetical protein
MQARDVKVSVVLKYVMSLPKRPEQRQIDSEQDCLEADTSPARCDSVNLHARDRCSRCGLDRATCVKGPDSDHAPLSPNRIRVSQHLVCIQLGIAGSV